MLTDAYAWRAPTHTHTHTHTLSNTQANTHLMEFMRAVDTVIKGEGRGIQCLRALERTCLT